MLHPTLRRCVFWGHLITGVAVGLIILILAGTGILMSFEQQITGAVERSMVGETTGARLAPEAMVDAFTSSGVEGQPGWLYYTSNPNDPVILLVGKGSQQLFHPATGAPLGKGATGTRRFFQSILALHRWLTFSAPSPESQARKNTAGPKPLAWRDIGGNINAAGCLAFLILLLSGLILWIPKKRTAQGFKAVLLPNRKLKGRARDWNWHNLAGFWAAPLILTITLTGVIMFYPWANKLLFTSVGEQAPTRQNRQESPPRNLPIVTTGLDRAAIAAGNEMPGWQSMTLDLPTDATKPFVITMTDAGRGRPDRRVKLTLDRTTCAVISSEGFEALSPGTRLRQLVRWIHTGEVGGWAGQTLAALGSFAALVLVWTGYSLAWRRLKSKFVHSRQPTPPEPG